MVVVVEVEGGVVGVVDVVGVFGDDGDVCIEGF